jgi:hypothetical protein
MVLPCFIATDITDQAVKGKQDSSPRLTPAQRVSKREYDLRKLVL